MNTNDKIDDALCDLYDVKKTLHYTRDRHEDVRVIDLPKDSDGTEFTIRDCLENAIHILEQLKESEQ
tara:strand:- start:301 stop:501 length:201 start_codon:yes stop_codon:yes gene_type:complete